MLRTLTVRLAMHGTPRLVAAAWSAATSRRLTSDTGRLPSAGRMHARMQLSYCSTVRGEIRRPRRVVFCGRAASHSPASTSTV